MKRGAWSPRYRPSASGWVYPNSREILAEAFFGVAEEETTDRTGLGPFSRPSLMGVSQRLYGSFAGKAEATDPPEVIDVTDTLSVSLTESVAVIGTIAVTDTLSVQVTEAVEMFKAIEATDTLSVNAGDVASLLQNEAKAVTDTWSVAVTDAGAVEATTTQSNLHGRPIRRKTLRLRGKRLPDDDPAPELELPTPSPGPTAIPVALRATSPPVEPLAKYVRKAQAEADAVEREIAALLAKVIRAEQQEEEEILMLLSELD